MTETLSSQSWSNFFGKDDQFLVARALLKQLKLRLVAKVLRKLLMVKTPLVALC
jgi:hypothetical protein